MLAVLPTLADDTRSIAPLGFVWLISFAALLMAISRVSSVPDFASGACTSAAAADDFAAGGGSGCSTICDDSAASVAAATGGARRGGESLSLPLEELLLELLFELLLELAATLAATAVPAITTPAEATAAVAAATGAPVDFFSGELSESLSDESTFDVTALGACVGAFVGAAGASDIFGAATASAATGGSVETIDRSLETLEFVGEVGGVIDFLRETFVGEAGGVTDFLCETWRALGELAELTMASATAVPSLAVLAFASPTLRSFAASKRASPSLPL